MSRSHVLRSCENQHKFLAACTFLTNSCTYTMSDVYVHVCTDCQFGALSGFHLVVGWVGVENWHPWAKFLTEGLTVYVLTVLWVCVCMHRLSSW